MKGYSCSLRARTHLRLLLGRTWTAVRRTLKSRETLMKQVGLIGSSPGLRHTNVALPGGRPAGARNTSVDHHARQGRVEHRHARIQGRRAEQGDDRQGLRLSRPDARRRGVRERLSGCVGGSHLQGLAGGWHPEQHGPHFFGADGRKVALPDGQCGHHLFLGQSGRHQGADRR